MTHVVTWRAADGTETVLDETSGILVTHAPIGLEAPSPINSLEQFVNFDGAVLVSARRDVRSLVLPILFEDDTRVETAIARLATLLQSAGELEVSDAVQTRYLRDVIYDAGLNGQGEVYTPRRATRAVALLALDPWWYGPDQSSALPIGAATAFDAAVSFDAVLPFDGGTSVTVDNLGDTDAYPVVTVNGPATEITVGAAGVSWTTEVVLGASDVLVVDTRPGNRGPRLNGGAVNWALLSEASRLWALARGTVSIIVGVAGSSGATSATVQWAPRYATL